MSRAQTTTSQLHGGMDGPPGLHSLSNPPLWGQEQHTSRRFTRMVERLSGSQPALSLVVRFWGGNGPTAALISEVAVGGTHYRSR